MSLRVLSHRDSLTRSEKHRADHRQYHGVEASPSIAVTTRRFDGAPPPLAIAELRKTGCATQDMTPPRTSSKGVIPDSNVGWKRQLSDRELGQLQCQYLGRRNGTIVLETQPYQKCPRGKSPPPVAETRLLQRSATTGSRMSPSTVEAAPSLRRHCSQLSRDDARLRFQHSTPGNRIVKEHKVNVVFGTKDEVVRTHIELRSGNRLKKKSCPTLVTQEVLTPIQHTTATTPSKPPRSHPRVLTMASNALARLHLMPAKRTAGPTPSSDKAPVLDEIDPISFSDIAFDPLSSTFGDHLVTNRELRLNEGDNLQKNKVQQMVGSQRPPRSASAHKHRIHIDHEEVVGDNGCEYKGSSLIITTACPGAWADGLYRTITPDPFESEIAFESNLEHGILSSTPIGSSTPRRRHSKSWASVSSSYSEISYRHRLVAHGHPTFI